jgi:hypothetical protein
MQQYAPETVNLLTDLQRLVAKHQDAPHRMNDVVHGDFQHAARITLETHASLRPDASTAA